MGRPRPHPFLAGLLVLAEVVVASIVSYACARPQRERLVVSIAAINPVAARVVDSATGKAVTRSRFESKLYECQLIISNYSQSFDEADFRGEPMRIIIDGAEFVFDPEIVPSLNATAPSHPPVVVGNEVWLPPFAMSHNDYFVLGFSILRESNAAPDIREVQVDIEGVPSVEITAVES